MRNRRYNVTPNYIYLRPWYRTNQSGTEQHWDATEQTTAEKYNKKVIRIFIVYVL